MAQTLPERVLPHGQLYLWPDGVLFVGSDMINEPHRHFTASVSFAVEGTFKVFGRHDASGRIAEGVLVAPNTEQAMDARGSRIVILQVDPETADYHHLAGRFERYGPIHELAPQTVAVLRKAAREALEPSAPKPVALWQRVMDTLGEKHRAAPSRDPRILATLDYIKEHALEAPGVAELARRVQLSEGRLIHLFTQEMGLPIRRYMLWLRLRDAFLTLAEGSSLTHAAHRAGFADSAHLSRTFRGMFGIPPSFLVEGRGRVRTEFVIDPFTEPTAHPGDRERWIRIASATAARAIKLE